MQAAAGRDRSPPVTAMIEVTGSDLKCNPFNSTLWLSDYRTLYIAKHRLCQMIGPVVDTTGVCLQDEWTLLRVQLQVHTLAAAGYCRSYFLLRMSLVLLLPLISVFTRAAASSCSVKTTSAISCFHVASPASLNKSSSSGAGFSPGSSWWADGASAAGH